MFLESHFDSLYSILCIIFTLMCLLFWLPPLDTSALFSLHFVSNPLYNLFFFAFTFRPFCLGSNLGGVHIDD
ncbi:hypothetical protein BDV32DRAFT_36843 [Aspergillus pseudonomiae]|uniref:Uncharacterized protein n=1 Tax=Aspergillus pseudonomiae TaxID=1506151 RepID=A0A5N7DCT5_9EURO|nr:uncharacterized protein BDV37DRAFT_116590 [Aspergillus pseudonomiae]KAB8265939.1 hypothetical protein BDV32DRAFT_36843 [Aspergillus pseudonomiae]KAE8404212.1 hypothetical protein BDV37DRAFT_116590 [Aspergillus pseudonomiae]